MSWIFFVLSTVQTGRSAQLPQVLDKQMSLEQSARNCIIYVKARI